MAMFVVRKQGQNDKDHIRTTYTFRHAVCVCVCVGGVEGAGGVFFAHA